MVERRSFTLLAAILGKIAYARDQATFAMRQQEEAEILAAIYYHYTPPNPRAMQFRLFLLRIWSEAFLRRLFEREKLD